MILVAGWSGIVRSADGGATIQRVYTTTGNAAALTLDPAKPGILYARAGGAQDFDGVHRSDDHGFTWNMTAKTGPSTGQTVPVVDAADSTLYVVLHGSAQRSKDGGATFEPCAPIVGQMAWLIADPSVSGTVYAFDGFGWIFKSSDACASFSPIKAPGAISSFDGRRF